MGVGAYNRGSKALSEQIDRELQEKHGPVSRESFDRLAGEADILRRDLAQAKDALLAARDRTRADEETMRSLDARLAQLQRQYKSLREMWRAARRREELLEQRWRWVSSIVRACVSPERVQEFRDDPINPDVQRQNRRVG